jgi:ComF family protein
MPNLLFSIARRKLSPLVDVLYPPRCAACQQSGFVLCPTCIAKMTLLSLPVCPYCGSPQAQDGICHFCRSKPPRISAQRAACLYQEPLRGCIRALKYNGNTRLAEPLGLLLAQAYRHYGITADALLPVPLHSERLKARGYNHAALLAQVCARHLHIPYVEDLLVRQRDTRPQVGLSQSERQQNVQDAFLCSSPYSRGQLRGRTLVVIDDVCTSGATLEACAAPLFAAGAQVVVGLTLARPFG